ncbi:MAG TPA: CapA family protein [Solirubrobacteraceae bacterium]|nr:CapA family protein [Solirubrobacteraceae bacterium]
MTRPGPSIGLLGDVMLGRAVGTALASTPPAELWSAELRELTAGLELLVGNLECCISERGAPTRRIARKPFFFRGPPAAIDALAALGVGAVSLANNHALDYEEDALADTLALLDRAGIAHAGAGRGRDAARHGCAVAAGDLRVGLVAVADHPREYGAVDGRWGTAYAALSGGVPAWLRGEVARLRASCDVVIVLSHWGPNMASAPAPWQQAAGAHLQRAGADLIAGHSAHVFHGAAWTARGPILYDLGGAIDDYRVDPVLRNDLGLLAIWRPRAAPADQVELVGLRLEFAFTGLAHDEDADWIAARLGSACAALGTGVRRVDEQRFVLLPTREDPR